MATKTAKFELKASNTNAFRTIILIENSPVMWSSTSEALDMDTAQKTRPVSNSALLPPVRWTWLTWTAEACFEYCRVAWDIHPDYKVSIFGLDEGPDPIGICPFDSEKSATLRDLRLQMIRLMSFSKEPKVSSDSAMTKVFENIPSLETEAMLTVPIFYERLEIVSSNTPFFLRFVIVTAENDQQKMHARIRKCVVENNVGYLARYEVAVMVVGAATTSPPSYEKIDPYEEIYVTWYTVATGLDMIGAFKTCLAWDLRLSRTVVTDIPMREDVKSGGSTSVSYNVDLFHPCLIGEGSIQGRPGGEALRMKWMRPVKGVVPSLIPVENTQLIRASPSDPITRPSQCLVGYVLDGNAVLLENEGTGTTCKLFLCGGKISLQQLKPGTDRVIDDIPALSDLPGGRVSSYRVKEMVMLLSATTLDPRLSPIHWKAVSEKHSKLTSYFPIVYNDTIVYLLPQFIPLLEAVSTTNPKEADWAAARQAIEEVVEMEKHNQTLPGIASHALLQSFPAANRKAESYAVTWAELDLLLEACSFRSLEHAQLRDYLTRCVKRPIREDLKNLIKNRLKSRIFNGSAAANDKTVAASLSKKRKIRPEFEGRLKFGRFGKIYLNLQKPDKNMREDTLIHASIEL